MPCDSRNIPSRRGEPRPTRKRLPLDALEPGTDPIRENQADKARRQRNRKAEDREPVINPERIPDPLHADAGDWLRLLHQQDQQRQAGDESPSP